MVPVACAISRMMATRASAGHANLRQHFIGLGLQSVAGEDRDGLAECFVASGTSAAQVVVVERGQIVVNQGIGVQHFERRARPLDAGGQLQSSRGCARIMRPASMHRIGRRRLPPANTLCRMA